MKYHAVFWVSLMTHQECCIDRPFLWLVVGKNQPPPPQVYATGRLFKLAFWCLTLSTLKRYHMDLWLAWLILTHHHLHWLQHLPSANFMEQEWIALSYLWCFFSDGLPFALYSVKLRAVDQLSLLSWCFMRVDIYSAHWPPVWLPRLLSHWSGSQTVPLTLVMRLLASAELLLYWTSLSRLNVLRTIWYEWTRPR